MGSTIPWKCQQQKNKDIFITSPGSRGCTWPPAILLHGITVGVAHCWFYVNLNLTLPVQLMNHAPRTVSVTPCSRSISHDWQITVLLGFWISSKNICMHKVSASGASGDPSPESVNRCRKRLQFQAKEQEVPVPLPTCRSLANSISFSTH